MFNINVTGLIYSSSRWKTITVWHGPTIPRTGVGKRLWWNWRFSANV